MWRSPVFVLVALASALASPDLTVKTVTHVENPGATPDLLSSGQENFYAQGQNRRRESLHSLEPGLPDFSFATPRLVVIDRCDEGLRYELNPATHEYIRRRISFVSAPGRLSRLHWRIGRKDTLAAEKTTYASLDSETEDTGETQELFGQTAHHFITRIRRKPTAGSGQPESIFVADGWFIQGLTIPAGCPQRDGDLPSPSVSTQDDTSGGPKPLGLPVRVKYSSSLLRMQPDGGVETQTRVREREVVELSRRPLDSSLFDVPKGYRRVKHFRRDRHRTPRQVEP